MINTYARAYTEVLEILKYLPKHEYDKIPKSKIEFYIKNKDNDYIYVFDKEKNIKEQNISREANSIIITLFRDYFANDTQKEMLENILSNNETKRQQELQNEYNPDDIFKKKKNTNQHEENNSNENVSLVTYKESFLKKIMKKIKYFLNI